MCSGETQHTQIHEDLIRCCRYCSEPRRCRPARSSWLHLYHQFLWPDQLLWHLKWSNGAVEHHLQHLRAVLDLRPSQWPQLPTQLHNQLVWPDELLLSTYGRSKYNTRKGDQAPYLLAGVRISRHRRPKHLIFLPFRDHILLHIMNHDFAPQASKLVVSREDRSRIGMLMLSGLKVDINGARVAELSNGDGFCLSVMPGTYTLSAYNEMALGVKATVTFDVSSTSEVHIDVGLNGCLSRMFYDYFYARVVGTLPSSRGVAPEAIDGRALAQVGYYTSPYWQG